MYLFYTLDSVYEIRKASFGFLANWEAYPRHRYKVERLVTALYSVSRDFHVGYKMLERVETMLKVFFVMHGIDAFDDFSLESAPLPPLARLYFST